MVPHEQNEKSRGRGEQREEREKEREVTSKGGGEKKRARNRGSTTFARSSNPKTDSPGGEEEEELRRPFQGHGVVQAPDSVQTKQGWRRKTRRRVLRGALGSSAHPRKTPGGWVRVMACVAKGGGRATIRQQRKSCGEHEQNDETREIKLTNLGLQS